MQTNLIDIREDEILEKMPEVLSTLLRDHTLSGTGPKGFRHIKWATHDYLSLSQGFMYDDEIEVANITGEYGNVIQPQICKGKNVQRNRVKDKAEVFTPSWICNAQNNMVSIKKKTQDAFAQVYEFVPMQDFNEPWTDEKLYAKYGITPEEQNSSRV